MACNSQGSECTKESTVVERNQAEGNDDQEDGFLVNVPAEEEGRVTAECDCAHKRLPRWLVE